MTLPLELPLPPEFVNTASRGTAITQDTLIAEKSVTGGDIPKTLYSVTFMPYNWWGWNYLGGLGSTLLPDLIPARLPYNYTREGDFILHEIGRFEGRWGSAVATAGKKVASRSFQLKPSNPKYPVTNVIRRYGEMLHDLSGRNKSPYWFFQQVTQDYLTTDNGTFIEIDRQSSAAGSRIKGLYVLDSRRCRRTGVPEFPVIYTDLQGQEHVLRDYQVADIVDNPNTTVSAFGTGECAARRAYKSIRMMNAIDQFRYEKIAGAKPLALDFITGITEEQVRNVIKDQELQRTSQGVSVYGGSVLVPLIKPQGLEHVHIPLAELPANFDYEKERGLSLQDYANAIGYDRQELLDLSGNALGTATQSEILEDKERGKGLVILFLEITHIMQFYVLPDTVTFYYYEKTDYRDKKNEADVFSSYVTALTAAIGKDATLLSHDQALEKLVDEELLDPTVLGAGATPDQSLADTDKPAEFEATVEQILEAGQGIEVPNRPSVTLPVPVRNPNV